MPGINTEFFIARRIAGRGNDDNRNVMVRIATITVAISVAVMIVSLAVISGFRNEISSKVVGFGGHVQVVNLDGNASFETTPIHRDAALEKVLRQVRDFDGLYPYAVKGGILKTDQAMQGIMLKGVDGAYDWSFFADNLTEGRLPVVGDTVRNKDILVSRSLSEKMQIGLDDRIEMLFIQEDRPPRRDRFRIVGIYDSGFEELDDLVIPTDIRNVQRLNGWDSTQITGYEVTTVDFSNLKRFAADVYRVTFDVRPAGGESLMAVDIEQRYPNLFDWLKAHNVNAAVIITIMLLVALLNMISALLIILLERTSMIGVLKALGMNNGALQKLFVIRSGFIVLRGMVWGNVVGLALCLVQKYTHVLKLDQAGYFLSEVPVRINWQWLVALDVGTFVLLLALLTVPTLIVSFIKPDKTIRYQ